MTENLPFYEEESSKMPLTEYVDILAEPTWQEFCDAAKRTEFDVSDYDPASENDCIKIAKYITDLNERLGTEHIGMRSKVIGLGYSDYGDTSDTSTLEPSFINTDSTTFHGVDLCFVNGKWQAMLEFYCHEHTDELPHGIYHITPDRFHLMNLYISTIDDDEDLDDEDEEKIVTEFHEDFTSAQTFIRSEDFLQAAPDGQRACLSDIISSIDSKIPRSLRDRDVVMTSAKYYTAYDDMHYSTYDDPTPGFDLRDFLTDLTNTPIEERLALRGIIVGVAYPELTMIASDRPLTVSDLDMNEGGYCLVLRSASESATHYILPQTVTDIY
ncbi:MAG TPA: hypothetical protein VGO98_03180 [Candidatus Saccharimonadales bacterium]|nr:hypothetical protein [Candidatus Saccharimonadales bacterium]